MPNIARRPEPASMQMVNAPRTIQAGWIRRDGFMRLEMRVSDRFDSRGSMLTADESTRQSQSSRRAPGHRIERVVIAALRWLREGLRHRPPWGAPGDGGAPGVLADFKL